MRLAIGGMLAFLLIGNAFATDQSPPAAPGRPNGQPAGPSAIVGQPPSGLPGPEETSGAPGPPELPGLAPFRAGECGGEGGVSGL